MTIRRTRPPVYDDEVRQLVGGAPRLAFADILHHRRLPEARKLYVDGFLAVYGDDPPIVQPHPSGRAVRDGSKRG
jgi:hypothetical protein